MKPHLVLTSPERLGRVYSHMLFFANIYSHMLFCEYIFTYAVRAWEFKRPININNSNILKLFHLVDFKKGMLYRFYSVKR
jgi:hypothetical protein